MKYWVYKEARILGPFDKEGVSGLPGLDAGTLVCAGDPAGDSWRPVGEFDGLTGIGDRGVCALFDDPSSSIGLLDRLQIDSAGLIGDDEFPGAFAEELFQDASLKKSFGAIPSAGEVEAELSRDKISQLMVRIEDMSRHISEFEFRSRVATVAPSVAPSAPIAPVARVPEPIAQPVPVSDPIVAPIAPIVRVPKPSDPPPPLPDIPSLASSTATPVPFEPPSAPAHDPIVAPAALSFGKPKSFKIVPTVKSFKVLGTGGVAPAVSPAAASPPASDFKVEPIIETPMPVITPMPVMPVPVVVPAVPTLASAPIPEPTPIFDPFSIQSNTFSRSQSSADFNSGDLVGLSPSSPSQTAVDESAAIRFAKPEPAPPADAIKKPERSSRVFLVGGVVLVSVIAIMAAIFMRQPKDDLKQMATLDDGKAPIGLSADDGDPAPMANGRIASPYVAAPPEIVKPKIAEGPATAAPEAPPPGPSAEHAAAIELVKNFPLDGDRGTVGRWLQYSYTASPNAGAEEWNASSTGDGTVLVEYRLVPGASGGKGALYLFETSSHGLVIGKNIEARQMLAGGSSSSTSKPKKAAQKKPASRSRTVREAPKEAPLLPLPDPGELRPPADDDGVFGQDTVDPGI